ncbi:hypothetical protein AKJ09_09530 [Labilithrix luteola]|uniref:Methyltransferase type 11 domain-containing protein n=1 Tax=Labilithrix luteola TaxID=1391654 RepID=A0A0K1QB25_9BACT|nr:methyltransferase domain-containing protein [Labilithrix luteola]AKV02867.1 hypothetical protein AKJ09_09530 [Labilithrix luteola]
MNRFRVLGPALALFVLAACGGSPAEPPAAPEPAPSSPVTAPPPAAALTPPPPKEPTPEEKKKAEEQRQLAEDRAKMEADNKAEAARWTPELHAAAKALADKTYPTGKAGVTAAVASKTRVPGNADRDKYRHPVETLEFFGLKPTMTVIEYGPGDGWYTELLAPTLYKQGKLMATNSDPNGPIDQRSTYYGQRFKSFLDKAPEIYGKVDTILLDKTPNLGVDGKADMILVMRSLHGMENSGTLDAWLAEFNKALKPNGILGIEQHRAKPDANPVESGKQGYLPEKWVIEKVEAAGFKLAGKSEINANAKDTKDYPEGVWTLPPSFRLKDKDHDKYAAIGESDRMTLKFVKVPAKAAPTKTDAKAPAKPAAPKK